MGSPPDEPIDRDRSREAKPMTRKPRKTAQQIAADLTRKRQDNH